jgi:hypothetical protein
MEGGECKNVIMGDECGYKKFKPSSNDSFLYECCGCHSHYHVKLINDVPNFGSCQKKFEGKYCGC